MTTHVLPCPSCGHDLQVDVLAEIGGLPVTPRAVMNDGYDILLTYDLGGDDGR